MILNFEYSITSREMLIIIMTKFTSTKLLYSSLSNWKDLKKSTWDVFNKVNSSPLKASWLKHFLPWFARSMEKFPPPQIISTPECPMNPYSTDLPEMTKSYKNPSKGVLNEIHLNFGYTISKHEVDFWLLHPPENPS